MTSIYHITHFDRLSKIIATGGLLCDVEVARLKSRGYDMGTDIGIPGIKNRRRRNPLSSHPGLRVGKCVPFYFCPRSPMLYVIHRRNNPKLKYHGGQGHIVHLEANLQEAVGWARKRNQRWAFTTANAGSDYFDDYANLARLDQINWEAVHAQDWSQCTECKQAEFLIEKSFPWGLVRQIGVCTSETLQLVSDTVAVVAQKPCVSVQPSWYY